MADTATDATTVESVVPLPCVGGDISELGETLSIDLFTGTGSPTVPIALPPGRHDATTWPALANSSGYDDGPFGPPKTPPRCTALRRRDART